MLRCMRLVLSYPGFAHTEGFCEDSNALSLISLKCGKILESLRNNQLFMKDSTLCRYLGRLIHFVQEKYSGFLSHCWGPQLSQNVPADAGVLCDKSIVLSTAINITRCRRQLNIGTRNTHRRGQTTAKTIDCLRFRFCFTGITMHVWMDVGWLYDFTVQWWRLFSLSAKLMCRLHNYTMGI